LGLGLGSWCWGLGPLLSCLLSLDLLLPLVPLVTGLGFGFRIWI